MKLTKTNKILIAVLSCLIFVILAALVVFYIMYPAETQHYILVAWDWLNAPLPVVGVSTLFIGIFLIKLFQSTSLGKKQINEFKRNAEDVKEKLSSTVAETEMYYKELKNRSIEVENKLLELESRLKELYSVIPNKKIKELGDKYYGERKETIDNETKAD